MVMYERRNKNELTFHEDEIKLAKMIMDEGRTTLEFLYYLMNHKGELSFTLILLSADNMKNMQSLVKQWKRETDILLEIDKESNIYMIICQSTDIVGGKKFGEILMSNIYMYNSLSYCVETEVKTTFYSVQEVIFKMVEQYIEIKHYKESNKVFITTPEEIEYK